MTDLPIGPDLDVGWGPLTRREPRVVEIDDGLETELWDRTQEVGPVTSIRPYKADANGPEILKDKKILTGLWDVEKEWAWSRPWTRNVTTAPGFEMAYSGKKQLLQFRYIGKTEKWRKKLKTALKAGYGDADIEQLPPTFANTSDGRYASVVTLELSENPMKPIKNFEDNPEWFDEDPYKQITGQMTGTQSAPETDVIIQFVMRPARSQIDPGSIWSYRNWYSDAEKVADNLDSEGISFDPSPIMEMFEGIAKSASTKNKRKNSRHRGTSGSESVLDKWSNEDSGANNESLSAQRIRNQSEEVGFYTNIRIVAVSDDPEEAKERAEETARAYSNFYNTDYGQGFNANYLTESDTRTELKKAASREFDKEQAEPFGTTTWSSVCRVPTVDDREADYTLTRSDSGVPPRAPRFEDDDKTGFTDGEIPLTSWKQYQSDSFEWDPISFTPAGEGENEMSEVGEILTKRDPSEVTLHDDEDTYEGAFPRATIQNQIDYPDDGQPDYVGLDTNGREVPLLVSERNRHFLILGITGGGKSTTMNRLAINEFARGYGGVFSDPGGEDTYELLMALPKDRLDDVHIIDAGSDFSEFRVGINMLDTFTSPGEPGFEQEADNKLGVLLPLLETDDHARMKRVSSHIFRGLIEANYLSEFMAEEDIDPDELADSDEEWLQRAAAIRDYFGDEVTERVNYTVADARDILASKENREEWLKMMKEQGLERMVSYAAELAEMDNDDQQLEPLLGRLQLWLESANIRRFISERQSSLDIPKLLLNEQILIIKCDTPNKNVRRMVNATISRLLWSTVMAIPTPKDQYRMEKEGTRLPGPLSHEEYDGFPKLSLSVDELHSVVTPQMDLESMLAESRKRDLSLRLSTQQMCQLPRDQVDELISNVATVIAFNPGNSKKERNRVASVFPGTSPDELPNSKYRAKMMIPDGMGEKSEPFICNIFPPVSPRSSFDEVIELMQRKEREDGRRKTEREKMGLPPRFERKGFNDGPAGVGAEGGSSAVASDGGVNRLRGYKALYDACLDHGHYDDEKDTVSGVTLEEAEERLRWYLSLEDEHEFGLEDVLDKLVAGDAVEERRDGEMYYRPNADAIADIYRSGRGSGSGKGGHRGPMKVLYRAVTRAGGDMRILSQGDEGDGPTSDFRVALPPDFTPRKYPELAQLIGSGDGLVPTERGLYGELESSTGKSQPCQTLRNYADGVTGGSPVLFAVPDGGSDGFADVARQVYETMTSPPGAKRVETDEGRTQFYMTDSLTTNHTQEKIWRPRTGHVTRWYRDHETGDDVLADSDGREFFRFSPLELERGPQKAELEDTCLQVGRKDDINTDQYQKVPKPFDPEVAGVDEMSEDSYRILIIPDADRDRGPALYAGGDVVPLGGDEAPDVGGSGGFESKTRDEDETGGETATLRRSGPGESDTTDGASGSSDGLSGPIEPL